MVVTDEYIAGMDLDKLFIINSFILKSRAKFGYTMVQFMYMLVFAYTNKSITFKLRATGN